MGKSQYVSIQDAALLTDKSAQTIRRLIKSSKIRYRKYKTPQGFSYLVEKTSLLDHYINEEENESDSIEMELVEEFDPKVDISNTPRNIHTFQDPAARIQMQGTQNTTPHYNIAPESAYQPPPVAMPTSNSGGTKNSNGQDDGGYQMMMTQLIQHHRDDKKRLFELLEIFQKRILILEEEVKQLEAPKKKRWWSRGR